MRGLQNALVRLLSFRRDSQLENLAYSMRLSPKLKHETKPHVQRETKPAARM